MTSNLSNLTRDLNLQTQETKETLKSINWRKSIPNNIIIKLLKTKMKGKSWMPFRSVKIIRLTTDFSSETTEARKWQYIFKCWKHCKPRILYPAKVSFRNVEVIKKFSGKGKWREYVTSRPSLKEWLRKVLQKKGKQ